MVERTTRLPAWLKSVWLPWLILGIVLLIWLISRMGPGERVGLIRVSGVITAGRDSGGPLSVSTAGSESIVARLEEARKDPSVKAVVIRINSPGGSPAGSEEVYNEINRVRKSGKKVYVSMGDVAASGGYYIAAAADRIFADASSITGSIGVIYENPELTKLLDRVGVDLNVIATGKYKDLGNPARAMRPDERELVRELITDTYSQFISAVSKGRNMPEDKVRGLADGRVFTGRQARGFGLIDEIGGLRETVVKAARAADIEGEPEVKEFRDGGLAGMLFGSGGGELSGFSPADGVRGHVIRYLFGSSDSIRDLR